MEGKVNLGDTSVQRQGADFEKTPIRRIKMTNGQTMRVTFLSDDVISRLRHYVKGVGYRRCLSYQGFCPGCIAADKNSEFYKGKDFKRATEAFGANIFVYDTDPSMQNLSKNIGSIHLFVFGAEKFAQLRTIKQMYGTLVGLDLMITCIDGDFQKMTITPFPKESSFCNVPNIKQVIEEAYRKEAYPLDKMIAKEVSPAQMVTDFKLAPGIMNLPEAKSFQDYAAASQPEPPKQEFFNPTATVQKAQPVKEEPRVVDTSSLLDEL